MTSNHLLTYLYGISACFLAGAVACEAIFNGYLVKGDVFPYQVSVRIHGHDHVCGGGIIGERFILTAAQCVLNHNRYLRSKNIFIFAGMENLNKTDPPAVNIRVDKVFFPSEFHPAMEFRVGDIAVLRLVDSLQLEHHDRLEKLELPQNHHINGIAEIAGFGWHRYGIDDNERISAIDGHLRFAKILHVIEQCDEFYPHAAIEPDVHCCARLMSSRMSRSGIRLIPATACTGDEGGPLVSNRTVFGILSRYPTECDDYENHKPVIFTRVFYYLRMILNVMDHGRDADMISLHT